MNLILLGAVVILWMLVVSWQATKVSAGLSTNDRRLLIPTLLALLVMIGLALLLGNMIELWLRVVLLVVAVGFGLDGKAGRGFTRDRSFGALNCWRFNPSLRASRVPSGHKGSMSRGGLQTAKTVFARITTTDEPVFNEGERGPDDLRTQFEGASHLDPRMRGSSRDSSKAFF